VYIANIHVHLTLDRWQHCITMVHVQHMQYRGAN